MKTDEQLIWERYCDDLLLEKDHRKIMVNKIGIPEDVAEWLHEYDDKRSLWFANEIAKMDGFQNSRQKINWIQTNILTEMQGILDWIRNTPNVNLRRYDWNQAVEAQREYHENLEAQSLEIHETNKILKKYEDGFYWVDLETSVCTEEEGKLMGHCARTSAETMYSLRKYTPETQTIEAFVTIAANPRDGNWQQAKGKRNSRPKDEYHYYIADILVEEDLLEYQHEYDSANDFTNADLYDYISNNPEQFENPDKLLEKIDEHRVTQEDFEKVLNEFDFQYYSVNIVDEVEGNRIVVDYSIGTDIPHDKLPDEYYDDILMNMEGVNELGHTEKRDLVHRIFGEFVSEPHIAVYENHISVGGDTQSDDNIFSLTKDGLDSFKETLDNYKLEEDQLEKDEIIKQFLEYCFENILETNYGNFIEKLETDIENRDFSDDVQIEANAEKNRKSEGYEHVLMYPTLEVFPEGYDKQPYPPYFKLDGSYMHSTNFKGDFGEKTVNKLKKDKSPLYLVYKYWNVILKHYFEINKVRLMSHGSPHKIWVDIVIPADWENDKRINYDLHYEELVEFDRAWDRIKDNFELLLKNEVHPYLLQYEEVDIIDNFKLDIKEKKHVATDFYKISFDVINRKTGKIVGSGSDYWDTTSESEKKVIRDWMVLNFKDLHKLHTYGDFDIDKADDKLSEYIIIDEKKGLEDPRQMKLDLNKRIIKFVDIYYD